MSDWKEAYREQKESSGKTWDEFVQTELYHEDELNDLRSQVDQLNEDVTELTKHVKDLRDNISEVLILARHENEG